jgi:hypothetical protein
MRASQAGDSRNGFDGSNDSADLDLGATALAGILTPTPSHVSMATGPHGRLSFGGDGMDGTPIARPKPYVCST